MAPVAGVFRKPYNHWYGQRDRRNALLVASAANDLAQPLFTPVDAGQWHRYRDPLRSRPWDFQQRPRLSVPAVAAGGGTITIRGGSATVTSTAANPVSVTLTGTKQPQAGDLLVIAHGNDFYLLSNMPTPTVGGSSTGVTAIPAATADAGSNNGHVKWYWYAVPSSGDLTVSVTETGAGDEEKFLGVWVLTGADTVNPVADADQGFSATPVATHVIPSVTALTSSDLLLFHDNSGGGSSTSSYTGPASPYVEEYDANATGSMSYTGGHEFLTASGATGSRTITPAGSVTWAGGMVCITPAAGGAPADIPWTPQRFVSLRNPGQAYWLQPWRRLTDLVTQVDPLPSPLDVAYGDGGALWHIYDDRRSTSGFLGQRAYYDPTLLTPAVVDVPTSNPLDWAAYYDRRLAPQQRLSYDLSLLAAPPADVPAPNPVDFAAYADRRQVPRQRAGYDPTLLDTAQLEIAPPPPRTMWADRREVPQQRAYVSDPTLLDTAQLEDPLLAGAPERTIQLPRTWQPQQRQMLVDQSTQPAAGFDPTLVPPRQPNPTDRRLVPQQRTYFSEPGQPLDLTIFPGWQPYQTAALHVDRREVPQQRAYISDPSFYPQPGVTDPLTLAWGDGGTYWVLYNTAALQTSRRQVPQQRQLESIPGLLDTALLEDALLGGETLVHRMWYPDRRVAPQQPRPLALFADDADPTLLTGDRWRRYHRPAYTDRRLVPQQPARSTLYFDAGPDTPPLTLSWGAGGNLWHLYRWRRTPRSWWPPRLLFGPLGDPCTILRPGTGTTSRPGSGSTSRPGSGTTSRPTSGLTARPDTGQTEDPC